MLFMKQDKQERILQREQDMKERVEQRDEDMNLTKLSMPKSWQL